MTRAHQRRAHIIESAHGRAPLAPGQRPYLFELGEDEPLAPAHLTILQQIADGLTNQQIADRRGTSLHTVGRQVEQMFWRLHVHHRAAAVAEGFRRGLLH